MYVFLVTQPSNGSNVSTARKKEDKSFAEVIAQLNRAREDLDQLTDQVGEFVNWWGSMKSKLEGLQTTIPRMKLDGSHPLRTTAVKTRWEGVRTQYDSYQRRVTACC